MNIRMIAGLGLTLLAAGLLVIWYLGRQPAPGDTPAPAPAPAPTGVPGLATAPGPADVDTFLAAYNVRWQKVWTDFEGANWDAAVDISAENTARSVDAGLALGDYVGSREVIRRLRRLRGRTDLSDLQDRQVEKAWRLAAHYPGTVPEVVARTFATGAALNDSLHGHIYRLALPGEGVRRVTTNEIDDLLSSTTDLDTRRRVWECSKSVGPKLRPGLLELRDLRNRSSREMGYSSFFGLEVADYGLTSAEMMDLMSRLLDEIMPLYRQLHCWVKHELAARYDAPVPRRIPAHWLANRWAQSWPGVAPGVDLDAVFAGTEPEQLVRTAADFYVSLGLEPLPDTFWARSDLYELPADAVRLKNTHASAWHIDLDRDVRSLMNVRADSRWFQTTHHELGHVHYYLAYSRPEVPPVLRRGANRAFHEGIGTLIETAATQVPYLIQLGLLTTETTPDEIRWLLHEALTGPVVFLPFACGTMTGWEHDFYEHDLPSHRLNTRWWELAGQWQGVEPPDLRGEEWCDPATKTHVVDDAAQYYDYALSHVILHQLHRYICREILHQDVHAANYSGSREVGAYLQAILALGATRDGDVVLRQATGEDLSAAALLEYFAPLQAWLERENQGRDTAF